MAQYDALLTVCFGTADADRFDRCFAAVHRRAAAQGTYRMALLAVMSERVRAVLTAGGREVFSPQGALDILSHRGMHRVLVRSLFLSEGVEWERLHALCTEQSGRFERLDLTPPLLCGDPAACAAALDCLFPPQPGGAVLLYGHGREAGENTPYLRLLSHLRARGRSDIFLALMHGRPDAGSAIKMMRDQGIAQVRLVFFMLCTGHHAREALAPNGVAEQLRRAGIRTQAVDCELGGCPQFQQLFCRPQDSGNICFDNEK